MMRFADGEFRRFLSLRLVRTLFEMIELRLGILIVGIQLQGRSILLGSFAPLSLRFV